MRLNDLGPGTGSKRKRTRVGRGIAAGGGKTAGRGMKGQRSRSGGYHKTGFEGGQMPLQRRLPRSGFTSRIRSSRAELRLGALAKLEGDTVDVATLMAAGLVPLGTERVKLILAGEISRAVTIGAGVAATRGARAAIEAAGGRIEDAGEPAGKKTAGPGKAKAKAETGSGSRAKSRAKAKAEPKTKAEVKTKAEDKAEDKGKEAD